MKVNKRGDFFDDDDEDDYEPDLRRDEDFSGLVNKLKNFLYDYYEPVQNPQEAEIHLTTREISQQLFNIFPNEYAITEDVVANWMHNGGFSFWDYGEMRFEWMMKKKEVQG